MTYPDTTWTDQDKSATLNGSFFLLIGQEFFLQIDSSQHQLLLDNIGGTDWTDQDKS